MKRLFGVGALAFAWAAGCSSGAPGEATYSVTTAIQDGEDDTTHSFVVGVVQIDPTSQDFEVCSGALLAPNLVATARHCVATLTSPEIMCGSSSFGPTVSEKRLFVTNESQIASKFVGVAPGGIIVPSGANQAGVCGNDIALLVLQQNIDLGTGSGMATQASDYVVPALNPTMTSSSYSTNVTAIGYGINSPLDDAGTSAGVRRIKQHIALSCIPNDPNDTPLNCFTGPYASSAEQVLTAGEFVSGDASTCEGDSGSNAFDQAFFDKGEWVSFGVLSRGSVSSDGQTCTQPIYTRFDAWADLLTAAAKQAQSVASPTYPLPVWATGAPLSATFPQSTSTTTSSSSGGGGGGSSSGSPTATTGLKCEGTGTGVEGTACACANDCISNQCVSADLTTYVCANPCSAGECSTGFTCRGTGANSYCFAAAPGSSSPKSGGGCSVAESAGGAGPGSLWAPVAALALSTLRRVRRQRGIGRRASIA